MKPQNSVNLQRVFNATRYSLQGLKKAYQSEAAFRQEMWLSFFLLPAGLYLGEGACEKVLLCASVFIVLITELLNSAIEAVVDRIGSEFHELSGKAKDIGSAAVFTSIVLFCLTWLLILCN